MFFSRACFVLVLGEIGIVIGLLTVLWVQIRIRMDLGLWLELWFQVQQKWNEQMNRSVCCWIQVWVYCRQCCRSGSGSGSVLDPYSGVFWIRIGIRVPDTNLDRDPCSRYGSGSTHVEIVKNEDRRNKILRYKFTFQRLT